MRGEHPSLQPGHNSVRGPPPHARGTRWVNLWDAKEVRTTPACAGNTLADLVFYRRVTMFGSMIIFVRCHWVMLS